MIFGWFLVGFLIVTAAERFYETRYSQRAERGERKMPWVLVALHTLYGIIYAGTIIEYFVVGRPIRWQVSVLGLVLFGTALVVRLIAITTLGRFWSLHLEIRDNHQLIRHGIYAHLRHPAYLAIMIEVISIPLVANAYATVAIAILVYIPMLMVRWVREEREMRQKFGDEYARYARAVPAFLPLRWLPGQAIKSRPAEAGSD